MPKVELAVAWRSHVDGGDGLIANAKSSIFDQSENVRASSEIK